MSDVVNPSSIRDTEPAKRSFHGTVQDPEKGIFDFRALSWSDRVIKVGPNRGKCLQEVYLRTDRVQDFIQGAEHSSSLCSAVVYRRFCLQLQSLLRSAGEELRGSTAFVSSKAKASRAPTDFKRLQSNSHLSQKTLHCRYGPEDLSITGPVDIQQLKEERLPNRRVGKIARGESCKRGCQMQFTLSQLAMWPEITHIVGKHFDHINAAGVCCHDLDAGVDPKLHKQSQKSKKASMKSDDEVLRMCQDLIAETANNPESRQLLVHQLQAVSSQLQTTEAVDLDSANDGKAVPFASAQKQDGLKQIAAKLASRLQSPGRQTKKARTADKHPQRAQTALLS